MCLFVCFMQSLIYGIKVNFFGRVLGLLKRIIFYLSLLEESNEINFAREKETKQVLFRFQ